MHRIAATPGGWNPQTEGIIVIEQTPAPIIFITAADTDIQTLAASTAQLPAGFPALRVVNLLQLQQQLTIDTYAEKVLASAQIIILRLLGGRSYWSYGLEVVRETVQQTNAALVVLPGEDFPEPDLISYSSISLVAVHQLWRYFREGGVENFTNALKFIADLCLGQFYNPPPPKPVPRVGVYQWRDGDVKMGELGCKQITDNGEFITNHQVGILFYRAHYLAGNTAPIDALCQGLWERNLTPLPVFVSSLRDPEVQAEVLSYFQFSRQEGEGRGKDAETGRRGEGEKITNARCPMPDARCPTPGIDLLLNTTSFSVAKLDSELPELELWQSLDVPVLQVILSGGTVAQWHSQFQGLTPRDTAMNVALPEVDGRIITRAVSFKSVQTWNGRLETDVVGYEPVGDRIDFVADLAASWVKLRQTPVSQRKVALILANYPNRDGRLANGVGLDTPTSCLEILQALQQAGYLVEDIPETGDKLIERLTSGITNDPEGWEYRLVHQELSGQEYQEYFTSLPVEVQKGIGDRWENSQFTQQNSKFPIPGIQLGNIFVGIQPSRGYDLDPTLNYHAPDLEPTPAYLAFYYWLRQKFAAVAIVHVGKHGNLEWLPGKSLALSSNCYPEVALGPMPHFYPFIVNDPGEGAQAKRRSQAVIIDHLTPPMTRAELYGALLQLEGLIDEYDQAQSLDPSRLPSIRDRITQLMVTENLAIELGLSDESGENAELLPASISDKILNRLDGYLCELKEAQIRDGLHIFGHCPQGRQLRDLIIAIARHPGQGRLGLTRALAQDWGWDFDPLVTEKNLPIADFISKNSIVTNFPAGNRELLTGNIIESKFNYPRIGEIRNVGDAITFLEAQAAILVEQVISGNQQLTNDPRLRTKTELDWIGDRLLPSLQQTDQEISQLLHGLNGGYIPSGASGAPTRGRPEVLPTGRNFYSVDIRAIPTETAWDVGRKAAEVLIERYTQEYGEYPRTIGISVWGTSTMRTGGDDLAQALALLGVRPIWDGWSRRVVDFEVLTLSVLGRPRVDVTLRISGFFRDSFPNLINLFYNAVVAVSSLDEPPEQNPLAAQVQQETELWLQAGWNQEEARQRACDRIFGSKPGAYGAGLQGLIEAQNWQDDQDLARAYINWSSYVYTGNSANTQEGVAQTEAFKQRLQQMQIVLQNQDNREHDLLDSDDYYQFQGGLTVAIRALTGKNPQTYFGDNSIPENPRVRPLREEIARVYRARVVNPKWIAGVMRHGYKGAFEMAATVDYLFAYDATANCVADYMYQGVAQAYLFEPQVQNFIQKYNPWALRDMAERLLEAHKRQLWQSAPPEVLEELRAIALQAEAVIEGKANLTTD